MRDSVGDPRNFENLAVDYGVECDAGMTGEFQQYWRSKCRDGQPPAWSDIDLMEVYWLAPWVLVKEWVGSDGEWRNRYFGTCIVRKLGVEGTGKLLGDYHSPEVTRELKDLFGVIRRQRISVRLLGNCVATGNEFQTFEGLFLPLLGATGEVDYVIGLEDYSQLDDHARSRP